MDYYVDQSELFYYHLFLPTCSMSVFVSLIAIFTICYIVIIILRTTTTNIILLHFNIVQAAYAICTPLVIGVSPILGIDSRLSYATYCLVHEARIALLIGVLLFAFLLVVDWFMKTYCERKYFKFCEVSKIIIVTLYVVIVIITTVFSVYCVICNDPYLGVSCTILLTIILAGFVTSMNIVHLLKVKWLVKKQKNNLGLAISSIFTIFWIPTLATSLLTHLGIISVPTVLFFFCLVNFFSPVAHLVYLYKYVDAFNRPLKAIVRCRFKEFQSRELDEDSSVSYCDQSGAQTSISTSV